MGLFRATRYVASLPLVDVDELVSSGVRLVLLDRDNTCVPRDATSAPAEVLAWLDRAREAGLGLCLVSNNFHSSQVGRTARELGVEVVDHAMKPAPFALVRAMRLMGASREETVMIGDQVFTDVAAGNLAGVRTILVRPQSRKDLWYTHVFRVFERLALHNVTFDGE
ncbi:YqeG family HAD IIIA-type phosphatase [Olsenella sp. DSM 107455]|uniref:YqeG family HAD IIIA-type phosphatase n=1 Tax=Thermophilibacter gallinarum TaxID=2779357 RepID=A0ABR9QS52_9ACTN|nr:YqeG family HAD IIIA-type phosphatase [Thermophilibacter gallinarum]MBE5023920.1 YqeG family HAD IIIA-type phosphatase [Thermophilibacter gallinarum]